MDFPQDCRGSQAHKPARIAERATCWPAGPTRRWFQAFPFRFTPRMKEIMAMRIAIFGAGLLLADAPTSFTVPAALRAYAEHPPTAADAAARAAHRAERPGPRLPR